VDDETNAVLLDMARKLARLKIEILKQAAEILATQVVFGEQYPDKRSGLMDRIRQVRDEILTKNPENRKWQEHLAMLDAAEHISSKGIADS
jgi:hypothetical protein